MFSGQKLVIREFHLDCEISVLNSVKLAFPGVTIIYWNVHILRNICKHFKRHLGAHFYKTKIFLEFFKVVTGSFYLNFNDKELVQEFLKILDSFVPPAGQQNSAFKSKVQKVIKYLKNNYFGYRARFPSYRKLVLTDNYQFSTNSIESLNRALKHFLGLGFIDMKKLDQEMHRFHVNKIVEETDGLEKGRLNLKRRRTLLREKNILQVLTQFESLTQTQKLSQLQYHLLEVGTLTKDTLSPEYFDCLPPLTEIETETEQTDPTVCIEFGSFLDETICSVPELEELPCPDLTEVPSFLGQNYASRDCPRVLRSNRNSIPSFHPFAL